MDQKFVSTNLKKKNYNDIIDYIYSHTAELIRNLEHQKDYNNNILVGPITKIINNVTKVKKNNDTNTDAHDLYIFRELIIFLSKKLHKLVITEYSSRFHVMQVNDEYKIKLMLLYFIFFHYEAKHSEKNLYAGIDFEFNQRKIALCQIGVFPFRKNKFIWVFDPKSLNTEQTNFLISYLFTSSFINKIVHGSDSLDIPYMFQELFMNNHDYIYSFVSKTIDTRFLCEYFKITIDAEKKCSIYDALMFFDVIDQKKYNELDIINKTMGPIQDVNWNVYNMSSYNLKYAVYDVLYLRLFLHNIIMKSKNDTPRHTRTYKFLPVITQFVYLDKWGIIDIVHRIKIIIDPLNNYFVKIDEESHTMINIFNGIIKGAKLNDKSIYIDLEHLLAVNYFKSSMTFLFKAIVYSLITLNYTVHKNKKEIFSDVIYIDDILLTLKKVHLDKLYDIVILFKKYTKKKLKKIIAKK